MPVQADIWQGQKIVVTGGCGFIGRHLVRRLVSLGADITVLDDLSTGDAAALPKNVRFIEGSVADLPLVKKLLADADGCFHLAAVASVQRSVEELVVCHTANETGTLAIIEGLRPTKGKLVYASSSAVFGHPLQLPLTVESATRPISPYGVSKLACELHARVAGHLFGIPSFGLRFFNVYGPEQRADSPYSGVIAIFGHRVAAGQPLTIFGDGEQSRDFVFVQDVVEALMGAWVAASPDARVELVGTGQPTTVRELADAVMAAIGRSVPVNFAPAREGDIKHSYGVCPFMSKVLGRPAVGLREGLSGFLANESR